MNTSELEMLIRNILSEQLTPEKTQTKGNGIFQTVDEAIRAAHQAFLRYQQCPLKRAAPLFTLFARSWRRIWLRWRKKAQPKRNGQ